VSKSASAPVAVTGSAPRLLDESPAAKGGGSLDLRRSVQRPSRTLARPISYRSRRQDDAANLNRSRHVCADARRGEDEHSGGRARSRRMDDDGGWQIR